jgi:hypothetical protein
MFNILMAKETAMRPIWYSLLFAQYLDKRFSKEEIKNIKELLK